MLLRLGPRISVLGYAVLICASSLCAQQKGQWVPGQAGLNAGILPDQGLTYANLTINYSAGTLNDANGNATPVIGTYKFWAVENIVFFVPKRKVLGAKLAFMGIFPVADGDLTLPQFGVNGGGFGYADTFVQPLTLGWQLKRTDAWAAGGVTIPTGRYTDGATNNVGSGYWGYNALGGVTYYITKNKATTANVTGDWEIHGQKKDTDVTPGQTVTAEWGLGQVLPLDKQLKKLLQLGVIGYDQFRVTKDSGTLDSGLPSSSVPAYSVHAVGFQSTLILPAKKLNFYFKYEYEYKATARPKGRTIAFGGAWTFRIPVLQSPQP